jgi:hypothetical protein
MPSAVPLLRGAAERAFAAPASVGGHPIAGWKLADGPGWKLADGPRPIAGRTPAREPAGPVAGRQISTQRPVAELPAVGQRSAAESHAAGQRAVAGMPAGGRPRSVPGQRTVVMAEPADSFRVPVTTCSPRERIDGDAVTRPPGGLTTTRPGPSAPRSRGPHPR